MGLRQKGRLVLRVVLAILATLYGMFALSMLGVFVLFLVYVPMMPWFGTKFIAQQLVHAWLLLNAVVCGLIAYGLVRGRNWSRHLVIAFNAVYVAGYLGSYGLTRLLEADVVVTRRAALVLVSVVIVLGGVGGLMLWKEVKAVMADEAPAQ